MNWNVRLVKLTKSLNMIESMEISTGKQIRI